MGIGLDWQLLLEGTAPWDPNEVLRGDRASEAEQEQALQQLAEAAGSTDPEARNRYAAALLTLGRTDEAERVWHALLAERPRLAVAWLNLATCHLTRGRLDECAQALQACRNRTRRGTVERQLAERRTAELGKARDAASRQTRLLELRAAALRERVGLGLSRPGDHKQLARTLYALTHVPGSDVTGRDVLDAARRAHEEAPEDPETLETFILGLLHGGSDDELSDALRALERVAPHSQVLTMTRDLSVDPRTRADADAYHTHMRDVARRALAGDRAAEDELRLTIQKFPQNFQYRVDLLFAVHNRGDRVETRRLVDELAAEPSADHFVHFHIAQFYWFLGEHERGRRHFALAYETAATEEDREDVREAVRTVGAGDPAEIIRW
ncbi:tetratricopeptide repeat protein [Streptomyces sp. JHA26]|uniref:tetratricopeptide repeat protein n=1 Tax=Streptomyces sp. JHA26 TaxID=1917143 RepID=UPI000D1AFF75|nr:tetratricopeptide repeat protein [Streptomyces sp. JHA26]